MKFFIFFLFILLPNSIFADSKYYNMGIIELENNKTVVTIFYPTFDEESNISKVSFNFYAAKNGKKEVGNSRLIIFSHGSGGSPWVHTDLTKMLVKNGFTVAFLQHYKDNYLDNSKPGPDSWKIRPIEVSNTIDFLQNSQLFTNLQFNNIGVIGGSAGGHTVLSLAGGEWSEKSFREYCNKNIKYDFSSCVGFVTILNNDFFDDLKIWLAKTVINYRFSSDEIYTHTDERIKAGVVMVAYSSDFLLPSLKYPKIPLGFVIAGQDINQKAEFHLKAVFSNCEKNCELIMNDDNAGHSIMLSPMPHFKKGSISEYLLSDPKDFNRDAAIPELNQRIVNFFIKYLQ